MFFTPKSIIFKNEHNLSINLGKNKHCYEHNMPVLLAQSGKAYSRTTSKFEIKVPRKTTNGQEDLKGTLH